MPRFIAFLRAINAGYGRTVKMRVLRELFESLGFSDVETFIASGNVVFDSRIKNTRALERKIEAGLREALYYPVAVFIRTQAELIEIANYEPFPPQKLSGSPDLNVIFLLNPPDARVSQQVSALSTGTAEFCVHGRQVYWLRHRNQAGEVFPGLLLDKTLPQPFTIRSMRTVQRMTLKYGKSGQKQ